MEVPTSTDVLRPRPTIAGAARLTVEGLGRRVGLVGPPAFVEAVSRLLPRPVWRTSDSSPERVWTAEAHRRGLAVSVDGEPLGSWNDEMEAALTVRGDAEIWAAAHAVGFVVVHACALAYRGRGLIIPGPSMAGKTTMALALVRAGAEYCSDEFGLLDDRGCVHPYPRRPSVRVWEGGRVARRATDDDMPGRLRDAPVPVGLIADLRYAGASTTDRCGRPLDVRHLEPPRAALALMANSVAARTQPGTVLSAASAAARRARAVTGVRGEADEAAAALLALM